MKRYIENLKEKPDHHKQRFALVVSGIFTLAIFGVWSFVTFHKTPEVPVAVLEQKVYEPSPFSSLRTTFASAFESIRGNVDGLKNVLNTNGQ